MQKQEMELYFHIPFCMRKCFYCDFLSAPADADTQRAYMEALLQETAGREAEGRGREVRSIFIGGGTPSLPNARWMEALLDTVRQHYRLVPDAEITIECNPGTVDEGRLRHYRRAGINRLSIGLQSADDRELAAIGRIHTWQQFLDTWEAAGAAGFVNRNVDLMSALPGQTPASCRRTLEKVLALQPVPMHISAYSLIVEEGTCFGQMDKQGTLVLPAEEDERRMYYDTGRMLQQAGYQRYEISNYALPGYECRHNCGYWQRIPYLGLGLGASSLMDSTRFNNSSDLNRYLEAPLECRENIHLLCRTEQMEEFLFLGLRMTQGVGEAAFLESFGEKLTRVYGEVIDKNIRDGLLYWREEAELEKNDRNYTGADTNRESSERLGNTGRYLALTERGLDLSNYVMAQFLLEEESS